MAFGSLGSNRHSSPMAEINVIPLVDIMLVLLVIFIITAPLLSHAVKLDLPQASSAPQESPAEAVQFAVDAQGQLFWNGERIEHAEAVSRFAVAGRQQPLPELHLRIDRSVRYDTVAELLSEASQAGLSKVAFVTDPAATPADSTSTPR
jgi:biopolymer transport protein ExbD